MYQKCLTLEDLDSIISRRANGPQFLSQFLKDEFKPKIHKIQSHQEISKDEKAKLLAELLTFPLSFQLTISNLKLNEDFHHTLSSRLIDEFRKVILHFFFPIFFTFFLTFFFFFLQLFFKKKHSGHIFSSLFIGKTRT